MDVTYYLTTPQLREYFASLPRYVQDFILDSNAQITTLGELMEIGEHFKKDLSAEPRPAAKTHRRAGLFIVLKEHSIMDATGPHWLCTLPLPLSYPVRRS